MVDALAWQEFAAFARARDVADRSREALDMPYAIEGDKVVSGHIACFASQVATLACSS